MTEKYDEISKGDGCGDYGNTNINIMQKPGKNVLKVPKSNASKDKTKHEEPMDQKVITLVKPKSQTNTRSSETSSCDNGNSTLGSDVTNVDNSTDDVELASSQEVEKTDCLLSGSDACDNGNSSLGFDVTNVDNSTNDVELDLSQEVEKTDCLLSGSDACDNGNSRLGSNGTKVDNPMYELKSSLKVKKTDLLSGSDEHGKTLDEVLNLKDNGPGVNVEVTSTGHSNDDLGIDQAVKGSKGKTLKRKRRSTNPQECPVEIRGQRDLNRFDTPVGKLCKEFNEKGPNFGTVVLKPLVFSQADFEVGMDKKKVLGKGGFGTAYRYKGQNGIEIVEKKLLKGKKFNPREILLPFKLDSALFSNVVAVKYALGELSIYMEYGGLCLKQLKVGVDDWISFAFALYKTICYLEKRKVNHRDIKADVDMEENIDNLVMEFKHWLASDFNDGESVVDDWFRMVKVEEVNICWRRRSDGSLKLTLIDFGSAEAGYEKEELSAHTPEYLPPRTILHFVTSELCRETVTKLQEILVKCGKPFSTVLEKIIELRQRKEWIGWREEEKEIEVEKLLLCGKKLPKGGDKIFDGSDVYSASIVILIKILGKHPIEGVSKYINRSDEIGFEAQRLSVLFKIIHLDDNYFKEKIEKAGVCDPLKTVLENTLCLNQGERWSAEKACDMLMPKDETKEDSETSDMKKMRMMNDAVEDVNYFLLNGSREQQRSRQVVKTTVSTVEINSS